MQSFVEKQNPSADHVTNTLYVDIILIIIVFVKRFIVCYLLVWGQSLYFQCWRSLPCALPRSMVGQVAIMITIVA